MATITANDGGRLARPAPLRQWLDQIVATLPEPRQQMYDLFVARGLDSGSAALELGTSVAEVRRLRSENQQAILRAFAVTALAAAETGEGLPGIEGSGCGQLRRILADARHDDGDLNRGGRRRPVALPAALRLSLSRHLGECDTCQAWRDDCMARWTPELLPILADAELRERATQDVPSMPEPRQADAPSRAASAGTAGTVVVRPAAAAAAGAGLLVVLLLLAFAWPGVLHWTRGSTAPSSSGRGRAAAIGAAAPTVTGTFDGVPGRGPADTVRPGTGGRVSGATQSSAALSAAAVQPSAYYTVQPPSAPTSSPAQPSFGPPSTGWPATQSPPPAPQKTSSPTPSAAPSTTPPTAPSSAPASRPAPTPSASATPTPTPTPTVPPATPAPTATPTVPPSAPAQTPSASPSRPAPTASAPAPSPPSASLTVSPSAVAPPSTVAPSASAMS